MIDKALLEKIGNLEPADRLELAFEPLRQQVQTFKKECGRRNMPSRPQ
jgi:hypothetical protein